MRRYFCEISTSVYVLMSVAFCVLAFLVFSVVESHAGGFVYKKIDSRHEPEMTEWIVVPGTNMKAGLFVCVLDAENAEYTRKAGILVNGEAVYYVDSKENGRLPLHPDGAIYAGEFDPGGETNFGIYNNYLLMDSWAYGSVSGHNRKMFLFRFGNDRVELLDVLVNAYVAGVALLDFNSVSIEKTRHSGPQGAIAWTEMRDVDADGNPEVELLIERGHRMDFIFELQTFSLYAEIVDDKLKVDFNPVLYKPLFEQAKRDEPSKRVPHVYSVRGEGFPVLVPTSPKGKSDAYYIYGFLAGEMTLDEIKSALGPDGGLYEEQYKSVVPLLEIYTKWDAAFHPFPDERPVLLKYDLNR